MQSEASPLPHPHEDRDQGDHAPIPEGGLQAGAAHHIRLLHGEPGFGDDGDAAEEHDPDNVAIDNDQPSSPPSKVDMDVAAVTAPMVQYQYKKI